MGAYNGPIYVYTDEDTVPTSEQGGYAGGDSTAAAVRTSLDQSKSAQDTVNGLAVTAQTVAYGEPATATITGAAPTKTINISIPEGMPDSIGADLTASSQASADDAAAAADRAEAAENAKFLTQDDGVETLFRDDVAGPLTQAAFDDLTSANIGDGATVTGAAVRDREGHVLARDHGALGDGSTNDHAAIAAALASIPSGVVRLDPGRTYLVDGPALTVGLRQTLEIPTGAKLLRPDTSPETSPVVLFHRHHGKIIGGGTIECLTACPDGIVRVERVDGACEWVRINDVHINGPGKTVAGSRGLAFNGNSTFQNTARGVTISNVETGVYSGPGANANHYEGLTLYNIGTTGYLFDTTIESSVIGGSIIGSHDALMFDIRGAASTTVVGTVVEPGGTNARMYAIDGASTRTAFVGVVDNIANLGTDQSVGQTTYLSAVRLRIAGGGDILGHYKGSVTTGAVTVPATGSANVVANVPGVKIGDDVTAHPNSLNGLPNGLVIQPIATGADEVTVRINNITSSSITLASTTNWRLRVWR